LKEKEKEKEKEFNRFILHASDVSSSLIPFVRSIAGQSSKLSQTFSNEIHFPVDGHLK
jgi:hypothetical protein